MSPDHPSLAHAFSSSLPGVRRAADAIAREAARAPSSEPFAGTLLRACAALGRPLDMAPLLSFWQSRLPGNARSDSRYRWEISHRRGADMPPYARDANAWSAWRLGDEGRVPRDPFEFETRLILPMVCTENAELLAELVAAGGDRAKIADELLVQAAPVLRRDFAAHVQMNEPWQDTLALFCLTRRPRTLALLHPVAVAIAASHAADCHGAVEGARYPYAGQPLVSASAQLASGLLALGSDLELVARLAEFVRSARRSSGGWGDGKDAEDVLTTLVAADLLGQVDPSFDPLPTLDYLASTQTADGLWHALGPEAPWLTYETLAWMLTTQQAFATRFRWPHRAQMHRDLKTNLPSFAHFIELADLFAKLPGLAAANAELAFIDLIGFRAFNNRFGQQAGDEVLAAFAAEIESIPSSRAIRDGGDEFLILGAPCRAPLRDDLDMLRKRWPSRFRQRFGADVPPVGPRIIVGRGQGGDLRSLRERLGQEITALKQMTGQGEDGILVESER
jgi:GGDEF domain-containing protein